MSRKGKGAKGPRRGKDAPSGEGTEVIEEFQRRNRAFQTEWNRNFLFLALPGFALFWLGLFVEGPIGIWLPVLGFFVFAGGLARGVLLMMRGRQCPACGAVQKPAIHIPWRSCAGCGVRLSHGVKDSR